MVTVVVRADARAAPLPDASVDLVVTSPPYWNLRKYAPEGGGAAYEIGGEPTKEEYLDNLWSVMAECVRILKPTGSIFVNIGDSYNSGPSGRRGSSGLRGTAQADRGAVAGTGRQTTDIPPKCLRGLPWRFALGCVDQLGLVLRRDIIWWKRNPLPESVADRCPTAHEYLFHLTKQQHYFSAADTIREPYSTPGIPGSVWPLTSQPFTAPEISPLDGRRLPGHYAAYPTALVRRIILGWSPSGICVDCGEGRRPVSRNGQDVRSGQPRVATVRSITGGACACSEPTAPTRPAIVFDPFLGTGTTALVASALGRIGTGSDAYHGYCRLAYWRVQDHDQIERASGRARKGGSGRRGQHSPLRGQQDLFGSWAG